MFDGNCSVIRRINAPCVNISTLLLTYFFVLLSTRQANVERALGNETKLDSTLDCLFARVKPVKSKNPIAKTRQGRLNAQRLLKGDFCKWIGTRGLLGARDQLVGHITIVDQFDQAILNVKIEERAAFVGLPHLDKDFFANVRLFYYVVSARFDHVKRKPLSQRALCLVG